MKINKNKKGIALILSLILILLLASFGGYLFVKSGYENELTRQFKDSTKAFWAAEAGIARMVSQLPTTTALNEYLDSDNNLTYNVPLATLVPGYTSRWTVDSTGTCASKRGTRDISIRRRVQVVVAGANSGLLLNAIETTGTLDIGNNVTISGGTVQNSTQTFEQVFGLTKAQVKAQADHLYTNPSTNQQPVSGITWVELTGNNKYSISSTWSGSGLLVVNGNDYDVALDISGQWTFTGVVWVIGKLSISGTGCHITGAAFAESGTEINKFTGSSELAFSGTYRDSAFGLLGTEIISWNEVNP